ncbi:hypothetical protein DPMN_082852 [Dreissena polymorpha]|uniref:Uncharacterized protein n=1 Tax=Dreissena polymorpha TaxID=45954 RepID=A0A9D4BJ84_DREPO|nr:hypothetical protein DPMN_082852 [Dreissena polymorpha]
MDVLLSSAEENLVRKSWKNKLWVTTEIIDLNDNMRELRHVKYTRMNELRSNIAKEMTK